MFKKFVLLSEKDGLGEHVTSQESILLNLSHLVSVKPIRIVKNEKTIKGYWIRTVNGKKYKALQIPVELKQLIEDDSALTRFEIERDTVDQNYFQ